MAWGTLGPQQVGPTLLIPGDDRPVLQYCRAAEKIHRHSHRQQRLQANRGRTGGKRAAAIARSSRASRRSPSGSIAEGCRIYLDPAWHEVTGRSGTHSTRSRCSRSPTRIGPRLPRSTWSFSTPSCRTSTPATCCTSCPTSSTVAPPHCSCSIRFATRTMRSGQQPPTVRAPIGVGGGQPGARHPGGQGQRGQPTGSDQSWSPGPSGDAHRERPGLVVDRIRDCRFDIVQMDLMMPIMDGFDATRTICTKGRATGRAPRSSR